MFTLPILTLLLVDLALLLRGLSKSSASGAARDRIALCALFFFSGMPALVYQIVWQRALFSIYGVNAQSVAVIVAAFMIGLGIGSLAGGWASSRFPRKALFLFGAGELGVALFGLSSLRLFHWAAGFSAGASLPVTILFGFALLIVPTVLMGATLPLLVQRLVAREGSVGAPVALLYFVNTFGSAVACYLSATYLLRVFGQSGSVGWAAALNVLVGMSALALGRKEGATQTSAPPAQHEDSQPRTSSVGLAFVMFVAGVSGFIALGLEIVWFRVFELASRDRAPAFALLLSTYLAGIGAGSYVSGRWTRGKNPEGILRVVAALLFTVGATAAYLPPLVAWLQWKGVVLFQIAPTTLQMQVMNSWFLMAAPVLFLIATAIGAVLPLLCESGIAAGASSGRDVSLTYAANIAGSTLGSLSIGFLWMNYFGVQKTSEHLAAMAVGAALLVAARASDRKVSALRWAMPVAAGAVACLLLSSFAYRQFFERLILGPGAVVRGPFAHVVENRNGVIAVGRDGTVYGNAVYDGAYNTDPIHDANHVLRTYAISLFHPDPKRVLMIGLSSGSWAQIVANHPDLESLEIVEINPGYLSLIPQYPAVASLLQNPRVHITIDDARRWLISHPSARYDVIVNNNSFYWRDHSSVLLSEDFVEIAKQHLNPGGIYFYNTTTSEDAMATGLRVMPYGFRVNSFMAVSDTPLDINEARWFSVLARYQIDGKPVFDPANPEAAATLARYAAMVQHMDSTTQVDAMETSAALNARLQHRLIITDANMGWEWRYP